MSCARFIAHIGDAFINSGRDRAAARRGCAAPEAGPSAVANVMTFEPRNEAAPVWSSGDVKVSAVRSTHVARARVLPGRYARRQRRDRGRCGQRHVRAAASVLDVSPGRGNVEGRGRHRPFRDPSGDGSGPGQRLPAADLFQAGDGVRPRRHGGAGGREAPRAHPSHPGAGSGRAYRVEGAGRGRRRSRLQGRGKESGFSGGVTVARDLVRIRLANGKIVEDRISRNRRRRNGGAGRRRRNGQSSAATGAGLSAGVFSLTGRSRKDGTWSPMPTTGGPRSSSR